MRSELYLCFRIIQAGNGMVVTSEKDIFVKQDVINLSIILIRIL